MARTAWSGFLSASECSHMQAIINKAVRYGFLSTQTPSVSDLFQPADLSLFQLVICNQLHVLHQLLPPVKNKTIHSLNHIIIYCQLYPPPSQKEIH